MSSNYPTIQQHEPLRVPDGWNANEKKLIVQLEELFDDIYRRFNRIRLEDLNKSLQSTIVNTADGLAEAEQKITPEAITNTVISQHVFATGDSDGNAVSVQSGETVLTSSEFEVSFNGSAAMHVDQHNADFYVDQLEATGHIEGDIVNRTTEILETELTAENAQTYINKLPKYLLHDVTVKVTGGTGNIYIEGFIGKGNFNLYITGVIDGRIIVKNCGCVLNIDRGANISGYPTTYTIQPSADGACIEVTASNVFIQHIGLKGKTRSNVSDQLMTGIILHAGATAYINKCMMDRLYTCIYTCENSSAYCVNCKGGLQSGSTGDGLQNYYWVHASQGSKVTYAEDYPYSLQGNTADTGTRAQILIAQGVSPTQSDGMQGDTPSHGSQTFSAAGYYRNTYYKKDGSWYFTGQTSWSKATPRKGRDSSEDFTKDGVTYQAFHNGLWYFNDLDAIKSAAANASTITVSVKRTSWGDSGSKNLTLYYYTNTYTEAKRPASNVKAAEIFTSTGVTYQNLAVNGTATFTITSLKNSIADGTIKGFGILDDNGDRIQCSDCVLTIS